MAEPDSPAGEPSPAPPPVSPDAPWQWSSVRERATTAAPVRVLPSAVGAELVAALRPPEVPLPAPGAEGVAVRRERRTTWGLRVACAAFVTLAGAGLLATDVGAGLRDDVLAQLPDLLVPGAGGGTSGPEGAPVAGAARVAPGATPPATVVPGAVLAPAPAGPPAPAPAPGQPSAPPPAPTPPGPAPAPPALPTPPARDGTVSRVLDPVVGGVADVAGSATGGVTTPVTAAVVPLTDAVTDLLDGVVDPVLGLLGGVPTGR